MFLQGGAAARLRADLFARSGVHRVAGRSAGCAQWVTSSASPCGFVVRAACAARLPYAATPRCLVRCRQCGGRRSSSKTFCPSGLRGWTQVPLARAAWVQIPQVSLILWVGGGRSHRVRARVCANASRQKASYGNPRARLRGRRCADDRRCARVLGVTLENLDGEGIFLPIVCFA